MTKAAAMIRLIAQGPANIESAGVGYIDRVNQSVLYKTLELLGQHPEWHAKHIQLATGIRLPECLAAIRIGQRLGLLVWDTPTMLWIVK